jgi:ATP adenylyltransferase
VERLWTPWRMEYIDSAKDESSDDGCIFCDKPTTGNDEAAFILARTTKAFALLNAYPYNPGHLMVAPFRHVGELEDLQPDELAETTELLQSSIRALKEVSEPHGFNLGMNLGRVAGAGIPGHVHWHLVPRWNGDTNFMAVLGETRVLPELLAETYGKLSPLLSSPPR